MKKSFITPFISVMPINELKAFTVMAINKKVYNQLPCKLLNRNQMDYFLDVHTLMGYVLIDDKFVFVNNKTNGLIAILAMDLYIMYEKYGIDVNEAYKLKETNQLFIK